MSTLQRPNRHSVVCMAKKYASNTDKRKVTLWQIDFQMLFVVSYIYIYDWTFFLKEKKKKKKNLKKEESSLFFFRPATKGDMWGDVKKGILSTCSDLKK
jgi:hypothetical protein